MNITFMVVTVFLFFFGLIFLGKLIISGYIVVQLSRQKSKLFIMN